MMRMNVKPRTRPHNRAPALTTVRPPTKKPRIRPGVGKVVKLPSFHQCTHIFEIPG